MLLQQLKFANTECGQHYYAVLHPCSVWAVGSCGAQWAHGGQGTSRRASGRTQGLRMQLERTCLNRAESTDPHALGSLLDIAV